MQNELQNSENNESVPQQARDQSPVPLETSDSKPVVDEETRVKSEDQQTKKKPKSQKKRGTHKKSNIYLIGFMGTGKTTTGRALARTARLGFIDIDELIEKTYQQSISAIFRDDGEKSFRNKEKETLKALQNARGFVIATGGGLPLDPENLQFMKDTGKIIHLYSDVPTLVERLQGERAKGRPLLVGEEINTETITAFLDQRMETYAQADYEICTSHSLPEDLARLIMHLIANATDKQAY